MRVRVRKGTRYDTPTYSAVTRDSLAICLNLLFLNSAPNFFFISKKTIVILSSCQHKRRTSK